MEGLAQFEGEETVEREQDVLCVDTVEDDNEDVYSSDSESDGTDDDDDDADNRIPFDMVMPTRGGRQRVLTSRMRDFIQNR